MKTLSLIWGLLAFGAMLVFLIPCLGFFNIFNIIFAIGGLIISIIALVSPGDSQSKGSAIAGLVLCAAAIVIGLFRWAAGGFIF